MNYKHGHARSKKQTKEYLAWAGMLKRCRNPKCQGFHKYGGRGIGVCLQWQKSFENFYRDVGPAPTKLHTLDRIDVNGHYEPGNVRWATTQEQAWNTRQNVRYAFDGQFLTLGQWSQIVGIKRKTLSQRIHGYGWSVAEALTLPVGARRGKSSSV